MKILVDMNLSPRWVSFFADKAITALHWSSIGAPDEVDQVIFDYAAKNEMTLMTNDLDFGVILFRTGENKPSVVQVRASDLMPDAIGEVVAAALKQFAQQIEAGAIVTIYPHRSKVRILPLS